MKNFITLTLLALLSLTFTSCSSDDDDATDQTTDYYFRAKIDGQAYEADPRTVQVLFLQNSVSISAKKEVASLKNIFSIVLSPFDGEGYYQTSDESFILHNLTFSGEDDSWQTFPNGQGVVTITKYDEVAKFLEGTFSFVGYSDDTGTTINVTDGEFKAKIDDSQ